MAREDSRSSNGSRNGSGNGSSSPAMDRLKTEAQSLVDALGERAIGSVRNKVTATTGRLTEYVEGGGGPGVMAAVTGARNLAEGKSPARSMFGAGFAGIKEKVAGLFGKGGKGGGSRKLKLTDIVESLDVGVPVSVASTQRSRRPLGRASGVEYQRPDGPLRLRGQPDQNGRLTWIC